jgi:hypothetical protein
MQSITALDSGKAAFGEQTRFLTQSPKAEV